jgi:hypothetical protein
VTGSPLLRALLAFLAIASAGFPLWKLTRPNASTAPPPAAVALSVIPVALTFSEVPESCSILHLGKALWTQRMPALEVQETLQLEYPREGIDLEIQVTWPPAEKPAALRVRITDPDGNEHEKTLWARGEMDEVLTFP